MVYQLDFIVCGLGRTTLQHDIGRDSTVSSDTAGADGVICTRDTIGVIRHYLPLSILEVTDKRCNLCSLERMIY